MSRMASISESGGENGGQTFMENSTKSTRMINETFPKCDGVTGGVSE